MAHSHRGSAQILQWGIFFAGLLIMSFGIVLTIKADFGCAPWDVLHIGLYRRFGLTIGTWSIIVGIAILVVSALLLKQFPRIGAFLNMIFVGIFIDLYMMIPYLHTPETLGGKLVMLLVGIVITGYGMGIYISANMGAGPRDSLMIALMELTGWKVQYIRIAMEGLVLFFGWVLGGPVSIGTLIFCVMIGSVVGIALPQCRRVTERMLIRPAHVKTNSC
ncbi:YczE/YyaS/YitT family protein [Parageobacillus thermoglucosidasius]|uniref:YczE/YyaS/YitT family protein n=1 Tax=Parageobacillus thermoglucosidasius TaxID=1426 RepID=UPI0027FFDE5E|nr:YitT family protein [Parageobacillus thermoglucosidasius]